VHRRVFLGLLSGAVAVSPHLSAAQNPAKIFRVGLLSPGPVITDSSPFGTAMIRGLAERGYELGKNLQLERRGADGHLDRLPQLVAELVASKIDVLATTGYPTAVAAKKATSLPIVAVNAGDPVGTGLVNSLSHPDGNLTGISDVSAEMTPKRLELLKQMAPTLRRVAVLWNADDLGMTLRYRASETGARALGISVQPLGVREPDDFNDAFTAMSRDMPDAILMVTDSLTLLNRKRVFDFAATHRLPAIYEFGFLVKDGGLMSYGPDEGEMYGRWAALVARVLGGAKPADLPFEEPSKFALYINLKTAQGIGLTVPPLLLAQADEVVE